MNIATRIKNNLVYAYHRRRMDVSLVNLAYALYDTSAEGRLNYMKYSKQYYDSEQICNGITIH